MLRIGAALLLAGALLAQPSVTIIRGARVVDGTGAPARIADVAIRGGAIDAVGVNLPAPPGARVIDAAGQTLLPGLFDLHTHLWASGVPRMPGDWGRSLASYLASGVTTVNDFSAYGEMFAPMRKLLESGAVMAPHVNIAARLSTPGGHGTEAGWGDFMTLTASTAEEAHGRMKTVLAYKPDVIKIFTDGWRYGTAPNLSSMNLETLSAMVADAHAANLKVFTHTVTLGGAKIAAAAGVDVLAHGIGDAPADDELIHLLKGKRTSYISTLAVYEPRGGAVADKARALLPLTIEPAPRSSAAEPAPERRQRWQTLLANVNRLYASGIPVACGTDAGITGTYHGWATLHELELLVEAGLTPLQAITAGTSASARALGLKDRGTIEAGKAADLVLVDGRPDETVSDVEKTRRVFLAGREIDLASLAKRLQSPDLTPLSPVSVGELVDDMESAEGRTSLGTLRVNGTDDGPDHSQMLFLPVVRSGSDHALMITAHMAAKQHPFVRLELPLTPGAVMPADISRYSGISLDVRGQGAFRLMVYAYGVPPSELAGAPVPATGEWQTLKIPFAEGPAWNPKAARAVALELAGDAGASVWLEVDNVRFY